MNSQSPYQLTFNPRTNRPNRAQKQSRYVTQYRNIASIAPTWGQNVRPERASQHLQNASNRYAPTQERSYIPVANSPTNGYTSHYPRFTQQQDIRLGEQQRKKQQIMKRVRDLQDKVLPMIEREQTGEEEEVLETGWQSRVEVKIMRLQRSMDNLRKEWEIEIERKLIELDTQWEDSFNHLVQTRNH